MTDNGSPILGPAEKLGDRTHEAKEQPRFPGYEKLMPSTCYRATREGLLESFGSGYVLYGRWDRLFGCWVKNNSRKAIEIYPDWPILSENGLARPAKQISALSHIPQLKSHNLPIGAKANISFAQYFYRIPKIVCTTVGRLPSHQWAMLDMASQDSGFTWFMLEESQYERQGFMTACYSLATIKCPLTRRERNKFAHEITSTKRRDFLSKVSGIACENRHVRFLEKLDFAAPGVDVRRFLNHSHRLRKYVTRSSGIGALLFCLLMASSQFQSNVPVFTDLPTSSAAV